MSKIVLVISSLLILVVLAFTLPENLTFPKGIYRSPIDHEILLSGTFGELRGDHFHTGIDIKSSNGKYADKIYAIGDGYISRIGISGDGYGNALYIDHPEGYTSVYGHLSSFPDSVAAYVKRKQYEQQSFALNLYPDSTQFKVKKGEVVAKMGNTGYSFGPHLHFEIRNTVSETPINPLHFGYKIKDNTSPLLYRVFLSALKPDLSTYHVKTLGLQGKSRTPNGAIIKLGAWRMGIGIQGIDKMDGSWNKNGIYQVDLFVDESLHFAFSLDSIPFHHKKYVKAHIDPFILKNKNKKSHKCFGNEANKLRIYQIPLENGAIKLYKDLPRKIRVSAKDFSGNISEFEFLVLRDTVMVEPEHPTYNYHLPWNEPSLIRTGDAEIYFPEGTLLEDLYLRMDVSEDHSSNIYSPIVHIHDEYVTLIDDYSITINYHRIPKHLEQKAVLIECGKIELLASWGGQWESEQFKAKVDKLGTFYIGLDTIPPEIEHISFNSNMVGKKRMVFKVTDNLEVKGDADDVKLDAYIDGNWVLLTYDAKTKKYVHDFESDLTAGSHELKLVVVDDRGNRLEETHIFSR